MHMGYSKLTWAKTYKLELVLLGTAKWAGELAQVWSTRPVCFLKV